MAEGNAMQHRRAWWSRRLPLLTVLLVALLLIGLRFQGVFALGWGVPLLGAVLAAGIAGHRRRMLASMLGGATAGGCIFFINRLDLRYTASTIFVLSNPALEAVGGGFLGAALGAIVGMAATMTFRLPRVRYNLRNMIVVVALLAAIFAGVGGVLRAEPDVRRLILFAGICAAPVLLVLMGLRKRGASDA